MNQKKKMFNSFFITMICFIFVFGIFSFFKNINQMHYKKEINFIVEQLADLRDLKNIYKQLIDSHNMKAKLVADVAISKRHMDLSKKNQKIMKKIQSQILELEKQEKKI